MGTQKDGGCHSPTQGVGENMKHSAAEIQQKAKQIIDEFAKSLSEVDAGGEPEGEDKIEDLRSPSGKPIEGFKERMMRNMPQEMDGQPRMERKGW